MASIPVIVKHQGKSYTLEVDDTSTGEVFKYQVYSLTGVEPDRQKILTKGKQLKDDTNMATMGLVPNQQFLLMGTASGQAKLVRPKEPLRFVEDMSEAEVARQEGATPSGIVNLGNTCYLNSTLQTLRSIPELQDELAAYKPPPGPSNSFSLVEDGGVDLVSRLKDLYKQLGNTTEAVAPFDFLEKLRVAYPQFAERSRSGNGYAQQDAEEAWSQIVSLLDRKLVMKKPAASSGRDKSFIKTYMTGSFSTTLECDEPAAKEAGEEPTTKTEVFFKLNCHIDSSTNHLRDGMLAALTEKVDKRSDALDREAVYTKTSKITRLPKYLTVHFVRFYWKRESQKKAKIMRKVTFPQELDIVEFCDDKLKSMLLPVRDMVREILKDEEDIERFRKRRKLDSGKKAAVAAASGQSDGSAAAAPPAAADGDTPMAAVGETFKTDAEVDAERDAALAAAKDKLLAAADPALLADEGANASGIYRLHAVVAHRGASADSGHYTAYVRKAAPTAPADAAGPAADAEDDKWWWFNDDKVSEVGQDKIAALVGGGESDSALVLLYKAVPLPGREAEAETKKEHKAEAA